MGCGESKHVATGNTISRKNSRAGSKRGETSETIEETSKNDSKTNSILVKEEGKNVNQDSGGDNFKAVAEAKDIAESTELKKEENMEKKSVRKENEEPVEGIAFEGISGRSEYYSPQEEAGKESLSNENVKVADAFQDKKLAQETKEETVKEKELAQETKIKTKNENVEDKTLAEETKAETLQEIKLAEETKEETKEDTVEDKKLAEDANEETIKDQKLAEEKKEETAKGEPETMKEENLVKETETAETSEAKVSTPVEKKEKESAVSPAAEDLKTE